MTTPMPAPYHTVQQALRRLSLDAGASWKDAAAGAGLTPQHFQRLFKRYTGVSPRQYVACLNLSTVKQRLLSGDSVYEASLAAGLSGGGRAHDLFIAMDGMSPGEFNRGGEVRIDYGFADSIFGRVFVAATGRGVCRLNFVSDADESDESAARRLARTWPAAVLRRHPARAETLAAEIFSPRPAPSPLHVRGANFQINVWRALLAIPAGRVISYQNLSRALTGATRHTRAVARAVALNPVAVMIPCHRVLSKDGRLTGYAWGEEKKRQLLAREFSAYPL